MIIGLTGGIGCGKSAVARLFRELGVLVVDSDQITRNLVAKEQPSLQKIIDHFGPTILQKDGSLNRAKLRSIIFESSLEKKWLEDLLHPQVKTEILKFTENMPPKQYAIIEIPLLIETDFQQSVDRVLVIDCAPLRQIERLHKRDGLPRKDLEAIMASQVDRKTRLSEADDIIENEGSLESLKTKVTALHHYYSELTKN